MAWKSESNSLEPCNYHVTSTPCVPPSSTATSVGDSGYCTEIKPPRPSFAAVHFPPLNLDITEECDHIHSQPKEAHTGTVLSDCSIDCVNLQSTDHESWSRLSDVTSGYFTDAKPSKLLLFEEQHVDYFTPPHLDLSEEKTGPTCDRVDNQSKTCTVVSGNSTDYINQTNERIDCECQSRLSDVASCYSSPDVVRKPVIHSRTTVFGESPIGHQGPSDASNSSCVDVLSRLFSMPPVAAVILRHVSDSDLCRYRHFCCCDVNYIHLFVFSFNP